MIIRTCPCGVTSDGFSLPELLAEGWTVWHLGESHMTCPRCSAVIARLERAVERGTLIS
jgi:hypothetical protein